MNNKIAILLGSETDRKTMESANKYYEYFGLLLLQEKTAMQF